MKILIWGKYKGYKPEVIDETTDWKKAEYLVREYRLAFGQDWTVWAEKTRDKKLKNVDNWISVEA